MAKFLQCAVRITHVHLFKSILENFKRGYMRLNKRPCAAIRDVRMFEVVRYLDIDQKWNTRLQTELFSMA